MGERMESIKWGVCIGGAAIFEILCLIATRWMGEGLLKTLLKPYIWFCNLFYNMQFIYREGIGYECIQVHFVISKECLGNTFVAMLFALLFGGYVRYISRKKIFIWFILSSFIAISLGSLANVIRILASVPWVGFRYFNLVHMTIGITLYIGILLSVNTGTQYFISRRGKYEQAI